MGLEQGRGETPSAAGLRRTLSAAKGVRAACWKGTRKRPARKQLWLEAGVNDKGFCVLRLFKARADEKHCAELCIMGPGLEIRRIENIRDKLLRFGFQLRGPDLMQQEAKELGASLYIYTATSRENGLVKAAIQALAITALSSGLCRFANEVRDTFVTGARSAALSAAGRGPYEELDDAASVGSQASAPLSRRDSEASLLSTASTDSARRRRIGFNPFSRSSWRRGSSGGGNSGAAAAPAASVGMSGGMSASKSAIGRRPPSAMEGDGGGGALAAAASVPNLLAPLHEEHRPATNVSPVALAADSGTSPGVAVRARASAPVSEVEACKLTSIVQCCWFLTDFSLTDDVKLFRPLPADAMDESRQLEAQLAAPGKRQSLRGASVDVVADVLALLLTKLAPSLIADAEYDRLRTAIERQANLGLDPSLSPAAASAASVLVQGMSAERAFVLRECVEVVRATKLPLDEASRVFGFLIVERLRSRASTDPLHAFPVLSAESAFSFRVLLETLLSGLTGPSIFQARLGGPEGAAAVQRVTGSIPRGAEAASVTDTEEEAPAVALSLSTAGAAAPAAAAAADELPAMWNGKPVDEDAPPPLEPRVLAPRPSEEASIDYKSLARAVSLDPALAEDPVPDGDSPEASKAATAEAPLPEAPVPGASSALIAASAEEPEEPAAAAPGSDPDGGGTSEQAVAVITREHGLIMHASAQTPAAGAKANAATQEEATSAGAAPVDRATTLERLIAWYAVRLENAPNAPNAGLWQREVAELQHELEELRGMAPSAPLADAEGLDAGNACAPALLAAAEALWRRAANSSADSLMKYRSLPARRASSSGGGGGGGGGGAAPGGQASNSDDPYLDDPSVALEDSDELLHKVLLDVDALAARYLPQRPPDDIASASPGAATAPTSASQLLVALLRENAKLRVELNEYQKGVIQRTQAKALEFDKAFAAAGPRAGPLAQQHGDAGPAAGASSSASWSSFARLLS